MTVRSQPQKMPPSRRPSPSAHYPPLTPTDISYCTAERTHRFHLGGVRRYLLLRQIRFGQQADRGDSGKVVNVSFPAILLHTVIEHDSSTRLNNYGVQCRGRIILDMAGETVELNFRRAWFLTTLMNLYKLHLRTIPAIRHTLDTSDGARDIEKAMQARKELRDAELTGWKLWCDMVFVCKPKLLLFFLQDSFQISSPT